MKTYILRLFLLLIFYAGSLFTGFCSVHLVQVANFSFTPAVISEVRPGDTIRWTWVSGTHTTTSTTIPTGASAWDHPISSSSTTFDYIPSVSGSYQYKCTIHASMGMTASFTVLDVSGTAGIWKAPAITILSNPFIDKVSFRYQSDHSYLYTLNLFDLTGKLVKEFRYDEKQGSSLISVDVSDLKSGIYFLEFINNVGEQSSRRVVKQ
jgi:plastocyanin